jgi:hypothetical protein
VASHDVLHVLLDEVTESIGQRDMHSIVERAGVTRHTLLNDAGSKLRILRAEASYFLVEAFVVVP